MWGAGSQQPGRFAIPCKDDERAAKSQQQAATLAYRLWCDLAVDFDQHGHRAANRCDRLCFIGAFG